MDAISNRSRRDAGIAVVRNYQPARIERELLAQVFDIVGRDSRGRDERSTRQGTSAQTPLHRTLATASETFEAGEAGPSQHQASEVVA